MELRDAIRHVAKECDDNLSNVASTFFDYFGGRENYPTEVDETTLRQLVEKHLNEMLEE